MRNALRVAAALTAAFGMTVGIADATTIRGLTLPAGATIDTEAGRAAVTANVRGDVTAIATLGYRERIIVWNATGRRRILEPPPGGQYDDLQTASTQDGVVAPDGTVYGVGAYPFSGAYSGVRTRLYAWHGTNARLVEQACGGDATDLHPTSVASDGRVTLAGSYDSSPLSIDAIEAGGLPPTASVFDGARCRALDPGWISALDGVFAAGHRGYQNGKLIPPNVNAQSQRYVAVRWTGTHAEELGPGAALAVNGKGDCAGSDAPPGIHGAFMISRGPNGEMRTYAIGDMHAMLWRGSTATRLSASRRSIAYGINETGRTIVGTAYDTAGQHAVRWRNGKEELLDTFLPRGSAWRLIVAYGVTPDGAIYGAGKHDGTLEAFVMSISP